MKKIAIVWRNPYIFRMQRRCIRIEITQRRRVYLVEELVATGDACYWSKAGSLEVVRGGRKAA
jgi:hypothetical protein